MLNKILPIAIIALLSTSVSGCVIHISDSSSGSKSNNSSISKVLGNIRVKAHRQLDDIDNVNGSITLEDHVTADDIDNVNGSVDIGDFVTLNSIEVVNGEISSGQSLTVHRDIETVNGAITLGPLTHVGDDISSVNGDIQLQNTRVDGDITTVNGDIAIGQGSVITGDIVFAETNNRHNQRPTLSLAKEVVIHGEIILKRDVELDLATAEQASKVVRRYAGI